MVSVITQPKLLRKILPRTNRCLWVTNPPFSRRGAIPKSGASLLGSAVLSLRTRDYWTYCGLVRAVSQDSDGVCQGVTSTAAPLSPQLKPKFREIQQISWRIQQLALLGFSKCGPEAICKAGPVVPRQKQSPLFQAQGGVALSCLLWRLASPSDLLRQWNWLGP